MESGSTASFPLLPGPLWHGVIIPIYDPIYGSNRSVLKSSVYNAFDYIEIPVGETCNTLTVSLKRDEFPAPSWVLSITLNCIWWCGSSSGNLESVDSSFIVITPRFTLSWSGSRHRLVSSFNGISTVVVLFNP